MLFDTHCHLDDEQFGQEQDSIVKNAREANVTTLVTVGTDVESCLVAEDLSRKYGIVYFSAGIHPHDANETDLSTLNNLVKAPKCVAIGETGLDYFKNYSPGENQKALFLKHIELAYETKKPLIIHCREAHGDCYDILKAHLPRPTKGVMHCYSGPVDILKKYLDLGFYISVAGPVTFPNARQLREVVTSIPLNQLVIETDSPYLAPQAFRGKRNEPAYVRFVALELSRLLNVDFEKVCGITTENAKKLFSL